MFYTITEWLVYTADSIVAFVVTFIVLIIAFLMLLIGSLFEDENSIYCETFDSPMELCESSENDLPSSTRESNR